VVGFPFARVEASPFPSRLASQHGRIEFAFATDVSVRLPLLPTPPRGDAVTVGYQAGAGLPEEGLHLLGQITLASALEATLVVAPKRSRWDGSIVYRRRSAARSAR